MESEDSRKFILEQQRATEQMFEMQNRSKFAGQNMPPVPSFVRVANGSDTRSRKAEKKQNEKPQKCGNFLSSFLGDFPIDNDLLLILGLLLILESEKGDRLLLAALLYIMS